MAMAQQAFLSLGPEGFQRIAYTDWGDARNAQAVLCVHGLPPESSRPNRLHEHLQRTTPRGCRRLHS